jgi:Cilia- and flagella-associated protein 54
VLHYLAYQSIDKSFFAVGVATRKYIFSNVFCCRISSQPPFTFSFQAFARRAIAKIDELSNLMKMSVVQPSKDSELLFTEATVKVQYSYRRFNAVFYCLPEGVFVMVTFYNDSYQVFCLEPVTQQKNFHLGCQINLFSLEH